MQRISDALELLAAQHDQLDSLLTRIAITRDATVRHGLVDELAELLTGHLAIEQEVFYPAIREQISTFVLGELHAEHLEIKRVLADLLWAEPTDERFDRDVAVLQQLLCGHAAWQDDQLFVPVAESMTDADLAALGTHLMFWFAAASTEQQSAAA